MSGFELVPYQLKEVKEFLQFVHPDVENMLLEKYNVQQVEQLRSRDCDEIIDFIQDAHVKLKNKK